MKKKAITVVIAIPQSRAIKRNESFTISITHRWCWPQLLWSEVSSFSLLLLPLSSRRAHQWAVCPAWSSCWSVDPSLWEAWGLAWTSRPLQSHYLSLFQSAERSHESKRRPQALQRMPPVETGPSSCGKEKRKLQIEINFFIRFSVSVIFNVTFRQFFYVFVFMLFDLFQFVCLKRLKWASCDLSRSRDDFWAAIKNHFAHTISSCSSDNSGGSKPAHFCCELSPEILLIFIETFLSRNIFNFSWTHVIEVPKSVVSEQRMSDDHNFI